MKPPENQPIDDVLAQFGIQLIAYLGGRINQHWLVDFRGQNRVLRRWASQLMMFITRSDS